MSPARAKTVAVRFRYEIEQAEARGAVRAAMTLRLTLGDADKLKRDRDLVCWFRSSLDYFGAC